MKGSVHVVLFLIAIIVVVCIISISLELESDIVSNLRRRLNYVPPASGEYTDYSFPTSHMHGTTSMYAYERLIKILKGQDEAKFRNIDADEAVMKQAVDKLEQNLMPVVTGNNIEFKNTSLFDKVSDEIMGSHTLYKRDSTKWIKTYYERLEEAFDIVLLTGLPFDEADWLNFLEAWKFAIEDCHLIIIQQGDPKLHITMPSWLNYDLFNKDSVDVIAAKHAWIFDWDSDSSSLQAVATIVGEKTFIYFMDRHAWPHRSSETGLWVNPIEEHLVSLLIPSNPYYHNTNNHPYRWGSDFSKSFPLSLREGIPTAISVGYALNQPHYDAVTRLAKPNEKVPEAPGSAATTLPHGVFYSMSCTNLAIRAQMMGPAMYFPGVLKKNGLDIGRKNEEVLAGWMQKVIVDHVRGGVSVGGVGYVLRNESSANFFSEVKQDLVWAKYQDQVYRFFATVELSPATQITSSKAMLDLSDRITETLGKLHPAFVQLGKAALAFTVIWNQFHGFLPDRQPVSSRSSIGPAPSSPHKCAIITIMHDEPVMLKVWTRYYHREFHGSIFIADHMFNASVHMSKKELKALEPDWNTISPGRKVTYWPLFGETDGFPVKFLVASAARFQFRLLRAGYKCVMYTDADEIVAPFPEKYPGGLSEYLTYFVYNQTIRDVVKTISYNLAHVSQRESDSTPPLEQPIDWDKPVLAQRKYWIRNQRYDKPLLSKVATRWKPGFHHIFGPLQKYSHDEFLNMIHLSEADERFCVDRELRKFQILSYLKDPTTPDALSGHIWRYPHFAKTGIACRYAKGVYISSKDTAMDNLGTAPLEKMSESWKNVVV